MHPTVNSVLSYCFCTSENKILADLGRLDLGVIIKSSEYLPATRTADNKSLRSFFQARIEVDMMQVIGPTPSASLGLKLQAQRFTTYP